MSDITIVVSEFGLKFNFTEVPFFYGVETFEEGLKKSAQTTKCIIELQDAFNYLLNKVQNK